MHYLMMIFAMFLIAGCASQGEPIVKEALLCDLVKHPFTYVQDELDVRAAKWPENLSDERKLNKHFERECATEKDKKI